MEIREVIEKIKQEKYDFSKPWTSLDRSDYKEGYNDACDDILDIIFKQLDEPQKGKVPAFVAEWYEINKKNLEYRIWNYIQTWNDQGWNDFKNWMNKDSIKSLEILTKMQYGYEVEEEPKYYVNIGDLYLKEPLGDTSDFTISMTWNREYAYPFDSWNMAREHASKLGGTVEKAEE
ncbi:DUF1642 domain-containing protein [Enterococcus avium]|uniref:DUF1642 domain-containing protein n=1 Tax=Enterococcus avium TaxID=33945 RepID=UPI0032E36E18